MNPNQSHPSRNILESYYSFKPDAPLLNYVLRHGRLARTKYTLVEILNLLKHMMMRKKLYDVRNQELIVCDLELEAALRVKACLVEDIRKVVLKQLTILSAAEQAELSVRYADSIIPAIMYGGPSTAIHQKIATSSGKEDKVRDWELLGNTPKINYDDINLQFEPSPGLRRMIEAVPNFEPQKKTFPYDRIVGWVADYLRSKRETMQDKTRHPLVACLIGDLAEDAFDMSYIHVNQLPKVIRKNIFVVTGSDASTSKGKREIRLRQ